MKTKILVFCVLFFCLLLQTTMIPEFFWQVSETFSWLSFLGDYTVDLSLLVLVYLGFARTFWSGILWACIATILVQTYGVIWKGSIHVSFFSIIILANLLKRGIVATHYSQKFVIVFCFSLLNAVIQLSVGSAFERFQHAYSGLIGFILVQSLINAMFGALVFRSMFNMEKWSNKRLRADKNIFFHTEVGYGFTSF